MATDTAVSRALKLARLDFAPRARPPSAIRVLVATAISLVGSLAADGLLVAAGQHMFPFTKHYSHFQFHDYSRLTIIGVIIACLAWPIVTLVTSEPRGLFFRLAIAVTLVLWLPDLYIWHQGQPARAVGVLIVMHLAIALVTYNALVHVAPIRPKVSMTWHVNPGLEGRQPRTP